MNLVLLALTALLATSIMAQTSITSCAQCSSGFGFVGSEQWCGCCNLNCGDSQAACIRDNGFCQTRCTQFGICTAATTEATTIANTAAGTFPPTPAPATTESADESTTTESTVANTIAGTFPPTPVPATTGTNGAATTVANTIAGTFPPTPVPGQTTEPATDAATSAATTEATDAATTTESDDDNTTAAITLVGTFAPTPLPAGQTTEDVGATTTEMPETTEAADKDCIYIAWGPWSDTCFLTCELNDGNTPTGAIPAGTRTRTRTIFQEGTGNGERCTEPLTETENCMEPCPSCFAENTACLTETDTFSPIYFCCAGTVCVPPPDDPESAMGFCQLPPVATDPPTPQPTPQPTPAPAFSCDACGDGFGGPGLELWCKCCQNNCQNFGSDCVAQNQFCLPGGMCTGTEWCENVITGAPATTTAVAQTTEEVDEETTTEVSGETVQITTTVAGGTGPQVGDECDDDTDCFMAGGPLLTCVDDKCAATLGAIGDNCQVDNDCAETLMCLATTDGAACSDKKAVGVTCTTDDECGSGVCGDNQVCAAVAIVSDNTVAGVAVEQGDNDVRLAAGIAVSLVCCLCIIIAACFITRKEERDGMGA